MPTPRPRIRLDRPIPVASPSSTRLTKHGLPRLRSRQARPGSCGQGHPRHGRYVPRAGNLPRRGRHLTSPGTGGLGREAVLELARHNPARIYFTGRSRRSAESLIVKCSTPETLGSPSRITFLECDHASLDSIRAAADTFTASSSRLDIFIANAGIMAVGAGVTKDGYEVQFGTNHVGNAALALRLLPVMERTAQQPGSDVRFVALTSLGYRGHPGAGIEFNGLRDADQFPVLGPWVRYGQSKLANILFARELGKRYPTISSVAVHPGVVGTDLVNNLTFWNRLIVRATNPLGLMTPRQGCFNTLWAATGSDVGDKMRGGAGTICSKNKVAFFVPVGVADAGDAKCWDDELMAKLWDWTVSEVGVKG